MNRKLKLKLMIILMFVATIMLNQISKSYPELVENYYSNNIDKVIRQGLSFFTSSFTFSVAEVLVISLFVILIASLIVLIVKIKKGGFLDHLLSVISYLSVLYILFMLFWGFNYNRLSFDKIAGMKIEKSSKQELYNLCDDLVKRANTLRGTVEENSQGVMLIKGGYKSVFKRSEEGYLKVSKIYPELSGKYGPPKPIFLSKEMSYTGITGIYIPYTGEPNVNINTTDLMLPCTALHEMAHQRGFAREDEANYISYLACIMHPDADFQYSGIMLAAISSMNALAGKDIDAYKVLSSKYSKEVRSDLQYERVFWSKYEGKIQETSNNVNNQYLKSNGQKDGVESYGRMVDLLLAEYRNRGKR